MKFSVFICRSDLPSCKNLLTETVSGLTITYYQCSLSDGVIVGTTGKTTGSCRVSNQSGSTKYILFTTQSGSGSSSNTSQFGVGNASAVIPTVYSEGTNRVAYIQGNASAKQHCAFLEVPNTYCAYARDTVPFTIDKILVFDSLT